jgi:hypothetical protein
MTLSRRRRYEDLTDSIGCQRWRYRSLAGMRARKGVLEEDTVADSVSVTPELDETRGAQGTR